MKEKLTPICPNCASDNVSHSRKPHPLFVVFIFLAGLLIPIFKKEYHCFDCGLDFKPGQSPEGL